MKRLLKLIVRFTALCAATLLSLGCAPSLQERRTAANQAIDLLQRSDFDGAHKSATDVLQTDADNPYAALVKAIAQYKSTMHQFFIDGRTMVVGAAVTRNINQEYLRMILARTTTHLTEVSGLLAVAAKEPQISMDLCVACMNVDWNQDGGVDQRDTQLFELEVDAFDNSIPRDDPRRKPTFKLDHGDVIWAQAFISFHLAVLNLLEAYDYSDINAAIIMSNDPIFTIRLKHPEKVTSAQQHILDGLAFSLSAREAYLAETDDEREWLPNPEQRNHPIPLEMTAEFYDTWKLVVTDLQKIVSGEESLSVAELIQLGDHQHPNPPRGYINAGKLFNNAKDIVIDVERMEDAFEGIERGRSREEVERLLEYVFGFCYVKNGVPSPLPRRIDRMKDEVERGHESLVRKLKYLFWVN
ncbi:MAG: hypothetical protein JXX14_03105 [Deltaproteobacteria bacterium]|nr:hypothetical protein [Deltaproteobacteria bacterium]